MARRFLLVFLILWVCTACVTGAERQEAAGVRQIVSVAGVGQNISRQYFLDFTFDEMIYQADGGRVLYSGAFRRNWYSRQLQALNEPSFIETLDTEKVFIRFLWLRTFHNPVAIRIERSPQSQAILSFTMTDGAGGYDPGDISASFSRPLTLAELESIKALLTAADLCGERSAPEPGMDGSQWIFERRSGNNYCVVDRWSPESGALFELGRLLLQLAGFEESKAQPIY